MDTYARTQEHTHVGRGGKQGFCGYSPGWREVCKIRRLENCQEDPIPESQVIYTATTPDFQLCDSQGSSPYGPC